MISRLIGPARAGLLVGVVVGAAGLACGEQRKSAAAGQTPPAAGQPLASAEQINRLIRQLGDDDYFVRQQAQDELAKLGVDAFDALSAATEDEDPEIAALAEVLPADSSRVDGQERPAVREEVPEHLRQFGRCPAAR